MLIRPMQSAIFTTWPAMGWFGPYGFYEAGGLQCPAPLHAETLSTGTVLDGPPPGNEPAGIGQFPEQQCGAAVVPRRTPRAGDGAIAA